MTARTADRDVLRCTLKADADEPSSTKAARKEVLAADILGFVGPI